MWTSWSVAPFFEDVFFNMFWASLSNSKGLKVDLPPLGLLFYSAALYVCFCVGTTLLLLIKCPVVYVDIQYIWAVIHLALLFYSGFFFNFYLKALLDFVQCFFFFWIYGNGHTILIFQSFMCFIIFIDLYSEPFLNFRDKAKMTMADDLFYICLYSASKYFTEHVWLCSPGILACFLFLAVLAPGVGSRVALTL